MGTNDLPGLALDGIGSGKKPCTDDKRIDALETTVSDIDLTMERGGP